MIVFAGIKICQEILTILLIVLGDRLIILTTNPIEKTTYLNLKLASWTNNKGKLFGL